MGRFGHTWTAGGQLPPGARVPPDLRLCAHHPLIHLAPRCWCEPANASPRRPLAGAVAGRPPSAQGQGAPPLACKLRSISWVVRPAAANPLTPGGAMRHRRTTSAPPTQPAALLRLVLAIALLAAAAPSPARAAGIGQAASACPGVYFGAGTSDISSDATDSDGARPRTPSTPLPLRRRRRARRRQPALTPRAGPPPHPQASSIPTWPTCCA